MDEHYHFLFAFNRNNLSLFSIRQYALRQGTLLMKVVRRMIWMAVRSKSPQHRRRLKKFFLHSPDTRRDQSTTKHNFIMKSTDWKSPGKNFHSTEEKSSKCFMLQFVYFSSPLSYIFISAVYDWTWFTSTRINYHCGVHCVVQMNWDSQGASNVCPSS